jgi:Raf kinase inhibitor-like YbhB/YbcL family protein
LARHTIVVAAAILIASCHGSQDAGKQQAARQPSSLYMSSSAFGDGEALPAEFTCDGVGSSPPLAWSDAPDATRSFALVVEDPDAPGGTFGHWGAYDIPAGTRSLAAAASGPFRQTRNDFDKTGYGPPCPPKGDKPHRYRFRLMALNVAQLPSAPSDVEDLLAATEGHVLGTAELTATYGR